VTGVLTWFAVWADFSNFFRLEPIPINQIATEEKTAVKEPLLETIEEVSLIAVGDILLSRAVGDKMQENGDDYPFLKVTEFLNGGDIVFGNLETPITAGQRVKPYEMLFRAEAEAGAVLRRAGFDILSLANNHTPNFGEKGLLDTFDNLTQNDIKYVGAGRNSDEANQPVYLTVKNITFAFLAYNDPRVVPAGYEAAAERAGTAFMRVDKMIEAVKQAKTKADFVIVSMHAGDEYVFAPNQTQITFARAAIDAGGELVIGHHPHVIQTIERYRGKNIFYSLGNFVFDQMQTRATREGLVVKIIFNRDGVSNISSHLVLIENFAQPRFLEAGEKRREKSLSNPNLNYHYGDEKKSPKRYAIIE